MAIRWRLRHLLTPQWWPKTLDLPHRMWSPNWIWIHVYYRSIVPVLMTVHRRDEILSCAQHEMTSSASSASYTSSTLYVLLYFSTSLGTTVLLVASLHSLDLFCVFGQFTWGLSRIFVCFFIFFCCFVLPVKKEDEEIVLVSCCVYELSAASYVLGRGTKTYSLYYETSFESFWHNVPSIRKFPKEIFYIARFT